MPTFQFIYFIGNPKYKEFQNSRHLGGPTVNGRTCLGFYMIPPFNCQLINNAPIIISSQPKQYSYSFTCIQVIRFTPFSWITCNRSYISTYTSIFKPTPTSKPTITLSKTGNNATIHDTFINQTA